MGVTHAQVLGAPAQPESILNMLKVTKNDTFMLIPIPFLHAPVQILVRRCFVLPLDFCMRFHAFKRGAGLLGVAGVGRAGINPSRIAKKQGHDGQNAQKAQTSGKEGEQAQQHGSLLSAQRGAQDGNGGWDIDNQARDQEDRAAYFHRVREQKGASRSQIAQKGVPNVSHALLL